MRNRRVRSVTPRGGVPFAAGILRCTFRVPDATSAPWSGVALANASSSEAHHPLAGTRTTSDALPTPSFRRRSRNGVDRQGRGRLRHGCSKAIHRSLRDCRTRRQTAPVRFVPPAPCWRGATAVLLVSSIRSRRRRRRNPRRRVLLESGLGAPLNARWNLAEANCGEATGKTDGRVFGRRRRPCRILVGWVAPRRPSCPKNPTENRQADCKLMTGPMPSWKLWIPNNLNAAGGPWVSPLMNNPG